MIFSGMPKRLENIAITRKKRINHYEKTMNSFKEKSSPSFFFAGNCSEDGQNDQKKTVKNFK